VRVVAAVWPAACITKAKDNYEQGTWHAEAVDQLKRKYKATRRESSKFDTNMVRAWA